MTASVPTAKCVLVIDDSDVILDNVRIILEEAGYRVVTLDNPLVMGRTIRTENPDLVLVDVNMPTLTGDRLVEIARRHGLATEVPVVLHSDMPVEVLDDRARKCGASGFIQKTSDEPEFLRQIRKWLAGGEGTEP